MQNKTKQRQYDDNDNDNDSYNQQLANIEGD